MRWMMMGLAASGALVYALVFLAQSQHQPETAVAGTDEIDVAAGLVEEIDLAETQNPSATLDPVAVSNPVNEQPETPAWMDDPWPAGVRFYQSGDYENAVAALEAAVDEREDSAYRHYLLGLAYLKNDESEGSIEELRRSLELGPTNVRALVNLARAYILQEDFNEARTAVDAALEADLDDVDAWNVLGRVEMGVGDLVAAEAAFSKAIEKDSTHAYAWNNLAYTRILQGKFEEALTPALAATESNLEVGYFYNNLGVVLEKLDDLDGARDAFARADEMGHSDAATSFARVDQVLIARGETSTPEATDDAGVVAAIEK